MSFPANEGLQIRDVFIKRNELGSGTYGHVWMANRKWPEEECSVKRTIYQDKTTNFIPPSCFRELIFLSEINYPHIVHFSLNDVFWDPVKKTVSFAYKLGQTDVKKLITYYNDKKMSLPPIIVKSILFQLLMALDHLHKRAIAHCDLTPSNLLLMSPDEPELPGILKVIDFGLSRIIEKPIYPRHYGIVTTWYRAPELLWGSSNYDTKVDIWSAGCIFAELICGQSIFATKAKDTDPTSFNRKQVDKLVEVMGPFQPDDIDKTAKHLHYFSPPKYTSAQPKIAHFVPTDTLEFDLLLKMLQYNSNRRISAEEAMKHPYFNASPICAINISRHIPENHWTKLTHEALHPPIPSNRLHSNTSF